jgi:NitT/TauT family transport system substrate-binding protein
MATSTARFSRARLLAFAAGTLGAATLPARVLGQTGGTPIRIGTVAADSYAEPYYAADTGAFTKAGLDADTTTFSNGAVLAAACAGGTIDVGCGDIVSITNAIAHGVPFVVIAGGGLSTGTALTTVLCVAKNSPLKSAKDLEGQAIGVVSLVSLSSAAVKAWLDENGVDIAKVRIVEIPFPQMAGALDRGAIAAALITEPSLSAAGPDVRVFAKPYDSVAKQFISGYWFTTRAWLAANGESAKRFVGAIYDTARWANAHQDDSLRILVKYTKLDLERARSMNRSLYATSLEPRLMQPVLNVAAKYKAIEKPFSAGDLIAKGF